MNNKVKIKVLSDSNYFIKYLINHSINYSSLIRKELFYYLIVDIKDYHTIKRRYETTIIKYYGKRNIIYNIKYHKYFIISFFICLFFLNNLTNTINYIEINTSNIELKNQIKEILINNNFYINKRKKSYKELNNIKEEILNKIDSIEWIEFNEIGTKYIININEKVKYNIKEDSYPSDIISSKNGLIKHIVVYNGTKLKEENEYVKKGEVLISGALYKDEELINYENAKGEVYAEVWYLTKVSIPFEYQEYIKTNNIVNHYYIEMFNKKFTILGKYKRDNMEIEETLLLEKPYLIFKLYKEKMTKYKYETKYLNEKEAYKFGLEESDKYIENILKEDEYIISKNILKKEVKSSKMYIEVFYKIYENIAITSKVRE